MNRSLAAALGLVLAGSLAAAVPSYADEPLPRPTITSPETHATVGDTVTITATAPGAPYVQFALHNYENEWQTVSSGPVPAGPDGTFSDTLPTRGLYSSFVVTARACWTSDASDCHLDAHSRNVKHAPLPTVTAGADWRDVIDPVPGSKQSVVIPDTTGIDVFLSTPQGRIAPGPAGPRSIDVSGLSDGKRFITIGQCSELNPSVCASRGVSFLIRSAPHAAVTGDRLLSQNWDDLWDAVDYRLSLDRDLPVNARWRVLRGTTTVIGPVDYPESVISTARSQGAQLRLDPRALLGHQLPAGSYQFQVEVIPDDVAGYTKRTRVGFPLQVANAPVDWRLGVDRTVIYPRDLTNAGPEVRLLHKLNADEVRYGDFSYRVVNAEGRMVTVGWYDLRSVHQQATWDGHSFYGNPLPAGRYRFEVRAFDDGTQRISRSPYFTLSHRRRVYERVMTAPARATKSLVRKSMLRYGRIVRGPYGSLDYIGDAPGYLKPDLRTLHMLKLPPGRIGSANIRFAGSWQEHEQPGIFLIGRHGRRHQVTVWDRHERGFMQFPINKVFVRPDGTVHFEMAVQDNGRTRIRAFRIGYWRYRWL